MLNAMSFESILKKAALPSEQVKALNDELQKIKKQKYRVVPVWEKEKGCNS